MTDLAVGGGDVMRALGCPPGPIIGTVLRRLLERVLDDPSLNTREALEPLIPIVAAEPEPEPDGGEQGKGGGPRAGQGKGEEG